MSREAREEMRSKEISKDGIEVFVVSRRSPSLFPKMNVGSLDQELAPNSPRLIHPEVM